MRLAFLLKLEYSLEDKGKIKVQGCPTNGLEKLIEWYIMLKDGLTPKINSNCRIR